MLYLWLAQFLIGDLVAAGIGLLAVCTFAQVAGYLGKPRGPQR